MTVTDLGRFLAARRARLSPDDVGLPSHGRRRVAGLRREEVAVLAGVSADYYTRLEQGRERAPSASVLDGIARALDLGPEAREHLFRLADVALGDRPSAPDRVDDELRDLLAEWPHLPAVIVNRRLDLLARNPIAAALYSDFTATDNLARMTFLDPVGRVFFTDWERSAHACVANLRLALGHHPGDRRTLALTEELTTADDDFRRMWEQHDVRGKTREAKTFRHSAVGEMTLTYRAFDVRGASGQQLIVYRAAPDTRDADAVRLLGMLARTDVSENIG
ncbi:transcriptional regulator [Actinoplanes philippinensis]|uniref:Transcriptional regulator, contains XRE-family HTH domain n=1 Tax=Actinoplanes philippinensis TaxID=35752 RepID=A0A1I2ICG9_9ACTN|nr:helix-turn-helix transcriptional regulator [Actinoplanes philippinensis]GIE78427.1 transcriptional regulator [Actinoplanes philippinensis]SFF39320.1 Transcriptional regulator, contains XRE-family HTH domain [Actinoplanes philippinensis]